MTRKDNTDWLPVISFFAILFFFSALGSLFNMGFGGVFVAFILWFVGTIATFFNDQYKIIHSHWTDTILPETHIAMIAVSCFLGLFLIFDFARNFRVDINISKKI